MNYQEDYVHTHLSGVAFHVHCVGLGCHVVIGVGRLVVRFHHDYAIPSFLLDVVVRLYFVIVNSNCSHNYCLLHIAKISHSRCCLYRAWSGDTPQPWCNTVRQWLHYTQPMR